MQEEQEARTKDKEKKEAEEAAKREQSEAAKAAAVDASGNKEVVEEKEAPKPEEDARMTKEQLGELAEALSILTAKSSIVKERDELKALLEDNLLSEAVSCRHNWQKSIC